MAFRCTVRCELLLVIASGSSTCVDRTGGLQRHLRGGWQTHSGATGEQARLDLGLSLLSSSCDAKMF